MQARTEAEIDSDILGIAPVTCSSSGGWLSAASISGGGGTPHHL